MFAFSVLSAPFLPARATGSVFVRSLPLCQPRPATPAPPATVSMALDPHLSASALSHLSHFSHLLSDASSAASSVAADAADLAADTAAKGPGPWNIFVKSIEGAIVAMHNTLSSVGVPGAYGFSIIIFTCLVKAVTFPLNYTQMESTMKMQALAPRLTKLKEEYKDNPAVLNQMTADLYRKENLNPLAGCLPVFVQIPVWIALYRSVLNLAAENLIDESFLWLPSLQGPVSKTGQGLSTWLYPLVDGQPPIGWHDALCYLILPVILVASQFYSQKIMQPATSDPQTKQANNFLKFMPLLIGWFSLNVPSGLGLYWVANNFLSTAQTLYIRSKFPQPSADASEGDDDDTSTSLAPPDGFSSSAPTSSPKAPKSKKRRKRR